MKTGTVLKILCFSFVLLNGLFLQEVQAATCTVNVLTDTGSGTGGAGGSGDLRYCITQTNSAAGADIIDIAITGTLPLNSSLPQITDSLTINGSGQSVFRIDGENKAGLSPFNINAGPGVIV